MNSYNNTRNMSLKGTRKQAMPAPKLMAIENEFHRTKDALVWEIKRLRGEVGVLAKRYNGAKKEIEDLVKRVRSQPPPPIPKRDEETERRKEERNKRWQEYLEKEREREEEQEKKKEEAQSTPTENEVNMTDPDSTPLDPLPLSQNEEIKNNNKPDPSDEPVETHLDGNGSNVEMVLEKEEEPKKKGKKKAKKEKKKEKEVAKILMPMGMIGALMRKGEKEREEMMEKKARRWEEGIRVIGKKEVVVDMKWIKTELEEDWENIRGRFWKDRPLYSDVIFYARKKNAGWKVEAGNGEWILEED